MDKIKVHEAILVEGKYDKNTLLQVVDALVYETDGFGIFRDPQKINMLRSIAKQRGLIVMTDSDAAGFVIRNRIKGSIPKQYIKHAYIPDVYGKEKRKNTPGREGKLGVEGMPPNVILESLMKAGAGLEIRSESCPKQTITKADYYELGLSGTPNSSANRSALKRYMQFPENMSSKALFDTLAMMLNRDELFDIMKTLGADHG